MDRMSKEVVGLLAYSLGGIVLFGALVAGVPLTLWIMVRTGYASWLFAPSAIRLVSIGVVLLVTGFLIRDAMRRAFGQR